MVICYFHSAMRVALVHDYLTQFGGAERVLVALTQIFPHAPIYTLLYDERSTGGVFKHKQIYTSFLQHIPLSRKYFRALPWLMPIAIEQFNFAQFELVISISMSFAKGIIVKPHTRHISYCSTPARYLWSDTHESLDEFSFPRMVKPFIPYILTYLRLWDYEAAQRVDEFIANSRNVQGRIKKYYNRAAVVIHPPVEAKKFSLPDYPGKRNYFLAVGRLVPYKHFDLLIETFGNSKYALNNKRLVIVGDGPERKKLQHRAYKLKAKNISFAGLISDNGLPSYYQNAQALLFPQEEDFGIVPLEAMACGVPVIAYRAGGALETVVENETGIFFDTQTPRALTEAIGQFFRKKFDPGLIHNHSLKWNKEVFKKHILGYIAKESGG